MSVGVSSEKVEAKSVVECRVYSILVRIKVPNKEVGVLTSVKGKIRSVQKHIN